MKNKVLVACEYSGIVRDAFIAAGFEAMSCDLLPTESEGPHYQGDVRDVLYDGWDLMVAHPPCTYLANSGVWVLHRDPARWGQLDDGAAFFRLLWEAPIKRICVENPVPHKYAVERIGGKYHQTIQPYQFGHPESKRTCLWLKNLPELRSTNILEKPDRGYWDNQTPSGRNKLGPSPDRAKLRSRFYEGIAVAMADQWGWLLS